MITFITILSFHLGGSFGFPLFDNASVLPDAARVIFWAGNDRVSFVVERARENLVLMPFKGLNFIPSFSRPNSASFVAARSYDFVALRVELNFWDFVLVTLQQSNTRSWKHIVNSCKSISWCGGQFASCLVEAGVKDFIIMTSECFDALPIFDIPQFASSIDWTSQAVITCEIKLRTWKFSGMTLQRMNAFSRAHVPNLCSIIKWCRQ